ncbi:MAG: COR domain-containing protein [Bryobacteraceae bacterium]|jgi:internalin A
MNESHMTFQRFRSVCRELGETDEHNQEVLAFNLHCLGISLNFRDDPRVRETLVLDPRWLTKGIYRILNARLTEDRAGALRIVDLKEILEPATYPVETHEFLLAMMRKFEMCFRYPEPRDDEFLLPQLLGKEEPELGDEFAPHNCLIFSFFISSLAGGCHAPLHCAHMLAEQPAEEVAHGCCARV